MDKRDKFLEKCAVASCIVSVAFNAIYTFGNKDKRIRTIGNTFVIITGGIFIASVLKNEKIKVIEEIDEILDEVENEEEEVL